MLCARTTDPLARNAHEATDTIKNVLVRTDCISGAVRKDRNVRPRSRPVASKTSRHALRGAPTSYSALASVGGRHCSCAPGRLHDNTRAGVLEQPLELGRIVDDRRRGGTQAVNGFRRKDERCR